MNVLLQSPNTHKIITLPPSLTEASPSILHRYMECYPPTLPSDASWDILFPVPEESTIVTFTRPPLAERSNLRKAALVKTRQELVDRDASAARYVTSLPMFPLVIIKFLVMRSGSDFLNKKHVKAMNRKHVKSMPSSYLNSCWFKESSYATCIS